MITIRHAQDRGLSHLDWLESHHSFSFANYYDANHVEFSDLRVINEDIIQPGMGFGQHPHNNMEIITYVVQGSLAHQDSLGTGSVIRPGEIQRMSAGKGITHSEYNHSKEDLLHLLQIWIKPNQHQLEPGYEQKSIPQTPNRLILIGSGEKTPGSVLIHQDIKLYSAYLKQDHTLTHTLQPGRKAWLQLIQGNINLNGHALKPGDGAAMVEEAIIKLDAVKDAEFLLFDLRG